MLTSRTRSAASTDTWRATLKHERVQIGDSQGARMSFDALVALARRVQRGGRAAIQQAHVRQSLAEIWGRFQRAWQDPRVAQFVDDLATDPRKTATLHQWVYL